MNKLKAKEIEWKVLISAIILTIVGIIALFSATKENGLDECKKQIIWFIISLIAMTVITLIDYKMIAKFSFLFYPISIVLLISVLFTSSVNGARSWFNLGAFSFQPSEISKIFIIISIAMLMKYLKQKDGTNDINKIKKISIIFIFIIIPIFLIIKQPDYGTAMVFIFVFLFMLYVARDKNKIYINFYSYSNNSFTNNVLFYFTRTCSK